MMASKGLGAGLGALFGEAAVEGASEDSIYLPISKIEPRKDQPRTYFDDEALAELAESIAQHGIIQPLTVRKLDGGYYQIIAGERRWRAARMAKLFEVPVRIIEADDKTAMELALVENLQREDLNPVEEAKGYKTLMSEYGLTQELVAQRVGKSRPVIANSLRLLTLPEEVLKMLESGELSLSHARAILELDNKNDQLKAAKAAIDRNMTVREATAMIKRMLNSEKEDKKSSANSKKFPDGVDYFSEVEKKLTKSLGRKVKIVDGKKKGKLEIEYYGSDDFEIICEALSSIKLSGGKLK